MFALRRAASRALAAPSFTSSSIRLNASQSIRSYSLLSRAQPALRSTSSPFWQRRFASDDAERAAPAEEANAAEQQEVIEEPILGETTGRPISEVASEALDRNRDTNNNRVFCGNLFFNVTEEQLVQKLSEYGTVKSANIAKDFKGTSKGFGFVTFENAEDARRAIEEGNEQMFEGRTLLLAPGKNKPRGERVPTSRDFTPRPKATPTRTLWIGNLSYDMTDTDLNNLFRPLQNVLDVRVAIDRRTGQARGFAHADFMDVESATKAMQELEKREVNGRRLRLDYGKTYRPQQPNLGGPDEPMAETF